MKLLINPFVALDRDWLFTAIAVTHSSQPAVNTKECVVQFPMNDKSFLLRTDFSYDSAWTSFGRVMGQPICDYQTDFECVSNEDFSGATVEQIVEAATGIEAGFVVAADGASMSGRDVTLAIDLWDVLGRTFRFIPSLAW